MTLINRLMMEEDIPFLKSLIKNSPEWELEECSYEGLEEYLKEYKDVNGKWHVWYADNKKMAISYSVEQAPTNHRPWIGTLLVEPSSRQKGNGKKIIQYLLDEFQDNNHHVVYAAAPIHQNTWLSFLSSSGFEQYKIEKVESKTYLLFVKPLETKQD